MPKSVGIAVYATGAQNFILEKIFQFNVVLSFGMHVSGMYVSILC